jgi:ferritin-like metal-binding protein YciE
MAIKTLQEKFLHGLGDIYDAEHQFLEAQQTMREEASSETVLALFEKHIPETEQQIANIEQIYEILGEKAERVKCQGAAGLVTEGNKLLKETSKVPTLADLAIAGANAKVEHYEISCYEGLIIGAEMMGQTEIVRLLTENLKQEQQTAQKISDAMPKLYEEAMTAEAGKPGAASA